MISTSSVNEGTSHDKQQHSTRKLRPIKTISIISLAKTAEVETMSDSYFGLFEELCQRRGEGCGMLPQLAQGLQGGAADVLDSALENCILVGCF